MLRRLFQRWVLDQWRAIDEECRGEGALDAAHKPEPKHRRRKSHQDAAALGSSARAIDWRPLIVLSVVAVSLTLQEYFGHRDTFVKLFPSPGCEAMLRGNWEIGAYVWWTGWRVFGYVLLPLAVLCLLPGERIADYGFSFKGFSRHVWIYVALFLAILPLVIAASFTRPFQHTYPFYKLANRSTADFLAWQALYAVQFFALEFFFRGFMLHGLKRALGVHAIWVMMVPYCMIHYGKPLAETSGAILAGVILGTLSLRTRSIWCGVLIHVSVALTMDWLAMGHCPDNRPCAGYWPRDPGTGAACPVSLSPYTP